jgi:hypothetical protein
MVRSWWSTPNHFRIPRGDSFFEPCRDFVLRRFGSLGDSSGYDSSLEGSKSWPGTIPIFASAQRPHLFGHGIVLAKGNAAFDLATGSGTWQPPAAVQAQ